MLFVIRKIKNFFHSLLAFVANLIYMFPSKDLYVIGVTGTDGKSTTAYYIYQILSINGKKAAFIGTTGAIIDGMEQPVGLHVTTPSPFALQKLVKKVKSARAKYLVLEVTSHGLDQHRVAGIPFQIGIITNVTPEHLDYHGTLENYASTKVKLLKKAKIAIVGDDESGLIKKYLSGKDFTIYGLGKDSLVNAKQFNIPPDLEEFNKKNMLGAISAARHIGLTDKEIDNALPKLILPKARLDVVYNRSFKVIIDFAHTPASFESLLQCLRKKTKGRLIHVFGAAGGRDKEKRKKMGEIASKYDDVIILTAEDPRNEKIEKINKEIKAGIKGFELLGEKSAKSLCEIEDRSKAIQKAVKIAKKGDTVLLTGKGHEESMNISGTEHPWDEYIEVEKALSKK